MIVSWRCYKGRYNYSGKKFNRSFHTIPLRIFNDTKTLNREGIS
jgi:hypothetical protein